MMIESPRELTEKILGKQTPFQSSIGKKSRHPADFFLPIEEKFPPGEYGPEKVLEDLSAGLTVTLTLGHQP